MTSMTFVRATGHGSDAPCPQVVDPRCGVDEEHDEDDDEHLQRLGACQACGLEPRTGGTQNGEGPPVVLCGNDAA